MNRKWLLVVLVLAFVIEVVSYYTLDIIIDPQTLPELFDVIMWFSAISFVCKSFFYIIIIWIHFNQKRYLVYSVVSLLTLVFFFFFFNDWYQSFGNAKSWLADFSFVFAIASLVTAIYISVDPSTRSFVKFILIINSLLLLLFKTPSLVFIRQFVAMIFGTTNAEFTVVVEAMIAVEYGIFGVWLLFQLYFVRKIDYI